jgi:hypothetical protein
LEASVRSRPFSSLFLSLPPWMEEAILIEGTLAMMVSFVLI